MPTLPSRIAVAAGMLLCTVMQAHAQGLVDLHAKIRVGNKICMADHFHDGNGSSSRSQKDAEAAAVRSWQDFTGWEYGSAWGNFWIAASRGIRCSRDGAGWSCHVQARPCRYR